jgi:hypothetical protein
MRIGSLRWSASTASMIVGKLIGIYRSALEPTGFRAGCPVGAVAQESFDDDALRAVVAETIGDWRTAVRAALQRDGFEPEQAQQLTDLAIASIEGALLLCRVDRTTAALDRLAALLEHQLTP